MHIQHSDNTFRETFRVTLSFFQLDYVMHNIKYNIVHS